MYLEVPEDSLFETRTGPRRSGGETKTYSEIKITADFDNMRSSTAFLVLRAGVAAANGAENEGEEKTASINCAVNLPRV